MTTAGGVGGGVAGHPLQRLGGVDELFLTVGSRSRTSPAECLDRARGVFRVMCRAVGHLLGDDVHLGVGHVQRPAHVPDGGPGGHGAEGDDLGHMVIAVLPADVVHHLTPAGVAEVHIDIGHGYPLRVQETARSTDRTSWGRCP